MARRRRVVGLVIGASVATVLFSNAALAGKRVVSGHQTLLIKARLSPSRARGGHVTFGFHLDYRSTTPPLQPPYNPKTITLFMPGGLVLNPAAAPACKPSQINKVTGNPSKCPRKTIVGHGTVVANAGPLVGTITGTAAIYNVGKAMGTRSLLLWVTTSVGGNQALPFRVMRGSGGQVKLQTRFPEPTQPGVMRGSVTIQTVDLSISGSGKGSFITNPPRCSGGWAFALTQVNYFGQPSITARDRVNCKA